MQSFALLKFSHFCDPENDFFFWRHECCLLIFALEQFNYYLINYSSLIQLRAREPFNQLSLSITNYLIFRYCFRNK